MKPECLTGTFQSKSPLKYQYFKMEPGNPGFLETSFPKYLFLVCLFSLTLEPRSDASSSLRRQPVPGAASVPNFIPRPRRTAVHTISSHHPGDACWLSLPTKNLRPAPTPFRAAKNGRWGTGTEQCVGAAHTTCARFTVLQKSAAAGAWRSGNRHIVKKKIK